MAILLTYLDTFDTDGHPCRQQRALVLPPNDFQNAPVHMSPRTLRRSDVTHLDRITPTFFTPFETHHS